MKIAGLRFTYAQIKYKGGPGSGHHGHSGGLGGPDNPGGSTPGSLGSLVDGALRREIMYESGKTIKINNESYVVLLHGTSSKFLDNIVEEGLQPKGTGHEETRAKNKVYLTGYESAGISFAGTMVDRKKGTQVVISCLIKESQIRPSPEWPGGMKKYYEVVVDSVPRQNIIGIFQATKGRGSYDLKMDFEDIWDRFSA